MFCLQHTEKENGREQKFLDQPTDMLDKEIARSEREKRKIDEIGNKDEMFDLTMLKNVIKHPTKQLRTRNRTLAGRQ